MSSPTITIIIVSILGFLPLAVILFGPKLVFWVGGWLGYYLRKKTAGRKIQILELVERDEEVWLREREKEGRRNSDEWESVEGYVTGSVRDGEREFDGIVGFFHPFWYALSL
jgi:alpha-1,2-mannosyltransferase